MNWFVESPPWELHLAIVFCRCKGERLVVKELQRKSPGSRFGHHLNAGSAQMEKVWIFLPSPGSI